MIFFFVLIAAFIIFAFFIYFESFVAVKGKFKRTRTLLLILLSVALLALLSGFAATAVYMHYNHEHYRRGIIRIGSLIKNGNAKDALEAVNRYAKEPVNEDVFSLDAALAVNRIIDQIVKEKNSSANNTSQTAKGLKQDSSTACSVNKKGE